jgi:denticleless
VSVNDGAHYLLDSAAPAAPPLAVFRGHSTRGFFVKAAFSPDGSHLLSGSADNHAYIWQVCPHCRNAS